MPIHVNNSQISGLIDEIALPNPKRPSRQGGKSYCPGQRHIRRKPLLRNPEVAATPLR